MKIDIRVSNGWKRLENKSKSVCDKCNAKLWIAPHGGKYCDSEHVLNPYAVALGSLGGSVTSEEKKKASQENGKKGGRPKKEIAK
jgi:hypothetical protein